LKMITKNDILQTLREQYGVLFAKPAIVHRMQYRGRDIIAKNSRFEQGYTDDRGYVPVEWWIMSLTPAENEKKKQDEGLSKIFVQGKSLLFSQAVALAEKELVGDYKASWPLTKILDIGGDPIKTSLGTTEVPPIPCHVHSGETNSGRAVGKGKLEAYFFPPVDVPPYKKNFGKTITRIALRADVTKKQVRTHLERFGEDDSMYGLLNVYEMCAYDGWTVHPKTVHAPGPWTTFEIQRAQDDFNLASWRLGERIKPEKKHDYIQRLQLRGLENHDAFVEYAIDWKFNVDKDFEKKWRRPSVMLESGAWGRRLQIFFDQFYGEGIEVTPGQEYIRKEEKQPYAGIVWSGKGSLNKNALDCEKEACKEFLVTPHTSARFKNTGSTPLLIYTVFPLRE
jgi:hypothetical protein